MSEANRSGPSGVRLLTAVMLALSLGVMTSESTAQVLYGTVVGSVHDSTGASMPGATVSVINKTTGLTRDTITSDEGTFSIVNVVPGTYDVKISLQGFREHVKTDVPISPGQVSRVEVAMEVGQLSETVTVASPVELLQTDKADLHTELKAKEITNLPLNQYRNYQSLINLVPGATPAVFQNSQVDTPGRSLRTFVNGTNPNNNNTRLDGALSVNVWLPHHVGYVQPSETIDTVNIATNSFEADQGMAGGAAITLITKSGTNQLKGSAFYFLNQDEFNARRFFDATKLDGSIKTMGGTAGGPILKNKLFYFGSWEGNREKNSRFDRYTVPTQKMRNGDFSEVLAIRPAFRLFDPATGNADGTGRTEFQNLAIPANRINDIAKRIQERYPAPNRFVDNNGLTDNLEIARNPVADRDNYDLKINWNRSASHQLSGKFSMLRAQVEDLFQLGFDGGGLGDTKVYVGNFGHTWAISPTMLIDGNFGFNRQDQTAEGPDFGQNFGLDVFGIPGTNGPDPRQGGLPFFGVGLSGIGNEATWNPVERHERSYTITTNLTKTHGEHEFRAGFDFVRHQLDHWQPEIGAGPRGRFDFSGNITGTPGYTSLNWNNYAAFLLGLNSAYSKSVQFEEMSGRENQYGFYVRDRWQVNNNFTLNLGLRYEYYPLMKREDRGIERLDYSTFNVLLGGVGNTPEDLGIKVSKTLFAPRLGATYRLNENNVVRAGYGMTFNPLPWSRPLRGFYPLTIAFSNSAENFRYFQLADGIPTVPLPDISSGSVPLPRGVEMRTPNPDDVERGRTHQWNVSYERRLPGEISANLAYVGTRGDDGYADLNLNYSEAGGGDAGRQFFSRAGTANVLDWAARTKSRYHALQVELNRPFKGGLLLKGAYTWSKAMNMADEDGWTGVTWNQPSQYDRNFALAGYDRTHMFQMGFLYELPFAREKTGPLAMAIQGWQVSGIFSAFSGTPFTIAGDNTALNQRGGQQTINLIGDITRVGDAGPDEVYYDPAAFAQPGNAWGSTGRNFLRGPAQWNLDLVAFKGFNFAGRYRIEFRAQGSNVLNHTRWGNPVLGFTDVNFMKVRSNGDPRRVDLGLRFQF